MSGPGHDDDLTRRLAYVRERAVMDELHAVTKRVGRLEGQSTAASRRLAKLERMVRQLDERERRNTQRLTRDVRDRRIDRQFLELLRRTWHALRDWPNRANARDFHVAVVCPVYPGPDRDYGGEFVRARVRLYREAGVTVTVLLVPGQPVSRYRYDHEGVAVIRTDPERLADTIASKAPDVVAIHHLTRPVWDAVKPLLDEVPLAVWVHGYEARDWRELEANYHPDEILDRKDELEAVNEERRSTLREAFVDDRTKFVFVSDFMRKVATEFVGCEPQHHTVIHNVIDERVFQYREKTPEMRHRVLWVRSFSAHNYANDLARDAVLELSRRPGFDRLRFTIVGDGDLFEEMVGPLRQFDNVTIRRGFVSTERIRELHAQHGLILVPTRWDSQGLICGEAMSSGLVPITTAVAAVPEFVSATTGILCPPEDPAALADGIAALQDDPDRFLRMSAAASASMQAQVGRAATTNREIDLLDPAVEG